MRGAPLAAMAVAMIACGERQAPAPTSASLGGEVARVGDVAIPVSLVARVASAQRATPHEALARLVEDALAASAARAAGLDRIPAIEWTFATARANLVVTRFSDEARALGAPRDDELATRTVVHAVVLRSPTLSGDAAQAFAEDLWRTVERAPTNGEFERRAKEFVRPGAHLRVETVSSFGADGLAANGSSIEPSFVAAAFSLGAPGDEIGVVETPFGWHVLRLVEFAPADAQTIEQRRRDLNDAVVAMRTRSRIDSLLRVRRQRTQTEVSGAADALMLQAVQGAP